MDWTPTSAPAGSEEKVRVLEERVRLGQPLWHPEDNHERMAQRLMGNSDEYRGKIERCIYIRGAHFHVKCRRGGRQVYVGYFASLGEAIAARDAFEQGKPKLPQKPRKGPKDVNRYITRISKGKYLYWRVMIQRGGVALHLGSFKTKPEAVAARDAWLRERGELAEAS